MKKLLLILLAYSLTICTCFGQIEVTGHVTDFNGEPILATIHGHGNSMLSFSKSDGSFEIYTSLDSLTLAFRAVGYKMKKVKILESKSIDVKLKPTYISKVTIDLKTGGYPKPLSKIKNINRLLFILL